MKSSIEIIPSSMGETRIHHSLISISDQGILSFGGENPNVIGEKSSHGELFLVEKKRMVVLPLSLTAPRSRFGSVIYRAEDHSDNSSNNGSPGSIYLFGGSSEENLEFSAMEEIRLFLSRVKWFVRRFLYFFFYLLLFHLFHLFLRIYFFLLLNLLLELFQHLVVLKEIELQFCIPGFFSTTPTSWRVEI